MGSSSNKEVCRKSCKDPTFGLGSLHSGPGAPEVLLYTASRAYFGYWSFCILGQALGEDSESPIRRLKSEDATEVVSMAFSM